MPSGRVSTTPDGTAPAEHYDAVVVGAGLLGAATAALLRRWAPQASLLLVEEAGVPNEGGATVASPGLAPPSASGTVGAAERWVLGWLDAVVPDTHGLRAGWLELGGTSDAEPFASSLEDLVRHDVLEAITTLLGVERQRPARLRAGGYLSAEAAALALARRAVADGADLALNARVRPRDAGRLVLERLALDRSMRLGVHGRQQVVADAVVVACGAAGGALAEAGLDRPVRVASRYRQFPRVRWSPAAPPGEVAHPPVVTLAGWTLRPAPEGAFLIPPAGPPDPEGYVPTGGRLLGVPVGVRRELLESMLDEPLLAPLLASGRLDLGKSVRVVRGARFSLTDDGEPVARALGSGWWLLAGGGRGIVHDLAAAARVAAGVAGTVVPW